MKTLLRVRKLSFCCFFVGWSSLRFSKCFCGMGDLVSNTNTIQKWIFLETFCINHVWKPKTEEKIEWKKNRFEFFVKLCACVCNWQFVKCIHMKTSLKSHFYHFQFLIQMFCFLWTQLKYFWVILTVKCELKTTNLYKWFVRQIAIHWNVYEYMECVCLTFYRFDFLRFV